MSAPTRAEVRLEFCGDSRLFRRPQRRLLEPGRGNRQAGRGGGTHGVPRAPRRARRRAAWGIAPGTPSIGYLGRVDPTSGRATFLRAGAREHDGARNVRFPGAGDGDPVLVSRLRAASNELGIVERDLWEPVRLDPREVRFALGVLASTYPFTDCSPDVVGEARARVSACAVTRCGDAPHPGGETGGAVPIGASDALLGATRAFSAGDRSSLVPAARARIVAGGRSERLVRRLREVALAVLGADRAGS
jgi:hypothetical protein